MCFALALQDFLLELDWPREVLVMKGCEVVYSNRVSGRRIYAGLRAGCVMLSAEVCGSWQCSCSRMCLCYAARRGVWVVVVFFAHVRVCVIPRVCVCCGFTRACAPGCVVLLAEVCGWW